VFLSYKKFMKIVLKLDESKYEILKNVPKEFLEKLKFPYTQTIWKIIVVKKFINFLKHLKNFSNFLDFLGKKFKIENCIDLPKIFFHTYAKLNSENICFNALYSFDKTKNLSNFFFFGVLIIKEYFSDIEIKEKVSFSKILKNDRKKLKIYLTEILVYQEILFEAYKYLFKMKKCEEKIEFFCSYHSFKDVFEFLKNYKNFEEDLQKSLIYLINTLRKIYEKIIKKLLYLKKEKVNISIDERIVYLIDILNVLELKHFWEKNKIDKLDEKIKSLINLDLLDFRLWMIETLACKEINEHVPFHLNVIDEILLHYYRFGNFKKALENEIKVIENKVEGLNEIFDYFLKLKIFNLNV